MLKTGENYDCSFVPWDTSRNLLEETNRLYDEAGTFDCIQKGDLVAVKLHVGELGNPYYVQPCFVHDIVRRVKEVGGKPFLLTPTQLIMPTKQRPRSHEYSFDEWV